MTETPETPETPEKPNNKALELAGELVSIIQDGKLGDQEKVEKVKTFIKDKKDKGLDLNVQGVADGRTVLHYAAEFGTPEMVKALVEAGAKENIPDNGGALPIHLATQNKKHPDVINQLNIDAYANARDSQEETPLFKAIRAGNLTAVNILLEKDADINAQNNHGWTPLMLATRYGTDEMVKALITAGAGAKIDAMGKDGWTALMLAARYGTDEMVNALIDAGAVVDTKDKNDWTPLMCAARYGTPENVKALIAKGADVNAQNNYGWTPLMLAVKYGTDEMVQALLQAGADKSIKNKEEKTALEMLEAELQKPDLKPDDIERLKQNKAALSGETDAGNDGKTGAEPKDGKDDKPKAGEPKDDKDDKDGEPQAGEPKDDKGDKPKGKPKGKPKPKGRGAPRTTGKPSGNATSDRPPEAQGPNATPEATPTQPTTREPQGQASGSTGVLSWIRNSMFGRFFGLDDESVAKRAQTATQLAQYGQEGGGWFRNSLLGRWLGLDDQTKLKELAQRQPAQPQNATVRAAYSGGNAAQYRTTGDATAWFKNYGKPLPTERQGQGQTRTGQGR